ncbi:MAG: hypothetical protein ACI9XK_004496 [Granulosicoccus sp.]|jgi:hypothetical protein
MIKHLVFMNYPESTSQAIKDGITTDLAALTDEIDGILGFGHGPNLSPEEPLIRGFKDMFWFDFKDLATRDAYLENETHKGIGARIGTAVDGGAAGVFVCDIEA